MLLLININKALSRASQFVLDFLLNDFHQDSPTYRIRLIEGSSF